MAQAKKKFSAQADPALLEAVREMAQTEGRQLYSLIDEAFRDLLEKRNRANPRRQVITYFEESLEKYGPLYERLAK